MPPFIMMDTSLWDAQREVNGKSVFDLPVDWNKAATIGISVAAIKISQGGLIWRNNRYEEGAYIDPAFRMQWAAASGRPRLAYHFFKSNRNAILQAHDTLNIWNSVPHTSSDRLCIDFETRDGILPKDCLLAMDSYGYEIANATGQVPFLYTGPAKWLELGGDAFSYAKKYPLWLAQWPLDNWIANTSIQLPPYTFSGDILTDLLAKVGDGRMVPLNGKPYYRMLSPWGDNIAAWQFTARAWTKDIPGHPALKKVADLSIVYKPWWTDASVPPVVEPRRCPTCGQLWPENQGG